MIEVTALRPAFLLPDCIGTLPDGLLLGALSVSRGDRRYPTLRNHCGSGKHGMSVHVQVFGRRQRRALRTFGRPASEKRQGTKSREVGAPSVPRAVGI
jgi:hypothetical protein